MRQEIDGNFSTDSLADNNKEALWKVYQTLLTG